MYGHLGLYSISKIVMTGFDSVFGHENLDVGQTGLVREREREMFYLTTHSTYFIYGYMASDIWLRTTQIVRKETRCRHIGYSYRLSARALLYAHPTDRITHTTNFVTPVVEHWPRSARPVFRPLSRLATLQYSSRSSTLWV